MDEVVQVDVREARSLENRLGYAGGLTFTLEMIL